MTVKLLYNKGFSGWRQFGIFICMVGVGIIASSLAAVGVWSGLTGRSIATMQTDMLNVHYAGAVKAMQVVSTVLLFFLPAVCYAFYCFRNGWVALGFNGLPNIRLLGIVLLMLLAATPAIDSITQLNKIIPLSASQRAIADQMEESYVAQIKVLGQMKTPLEYILSLIMLALLPAIVEEILFRGALQNMFSRWWKRPWLSIIISSIIFSAVHSSWYGFLPRIGLGILLGAIFLYTHNIVYNIVFHFINNAIVVTIMYLSALKSKTAEITTAFDFPLWAGLVSLVVMFFLVKWLVIQHAHAVVKEVTIDSDNPFAAVSK